MKHQICMTHGKYFVQTYGDHSIIIRDKDTKQLLFHSVNCDLRTESEIRVFLDRDLPGLLKKS